MANTILGNHPSKKNRVDLAVKSLILALVIWVAVCVAVWFIGRHNLEVNTARLLGVSLRFDVTGAGEEILTRLTLYTTLVLGILQLLLMIWPMLEYLFKFHKAVGMKASYKWYICPVAASIIGLLVIVIADAVVFQLGWITLIQLAGLLAVIFIPRVVPALQPL